MNNFTISLFLLHTIHKQLATTFLSDMAWGGGEQYESKLITRDSFVETCVFCMML